MGPQSSLIMKRPIVTAVFVIACSCSRGAEGGSIGSGGAAVPAPPPMSVSIHWARVETALYSRLREESDPVSVVVLKVAMQIGYPVDVAKRIDGETRLACSIRWKGRAEPSAEFQMHLAADGDGVLMQWPLELDWLGMGSALALKESLRSGKVLEVLLSLRGDSQGSLTSSELNLATSEWASLEKFSTDILSSLESVTRR